MSRNVWFMAPAIAYFTNLGAYPPEPPLPRPANVNPLTGLVVSDPSVLQHRPILARIGNDPSARSIHTGFNQADLVFEEMIDQEGGVFATTRYTLVFLGQGGTFRPLRSARLVNASLVPMFDGVLMHSGGSKDTRYLLSRLPWSARNLDGDFLGNLICTLGSGYQTHYASTVQRVREYVASKGQDKPVSLRGFEFADSAPGGSPATSVAMDHLPWPIRGAGIASWRFSGGRYYRYINGVPHNSLQYTVSPNWGRVCSTGPISSAQISAANVVVLNAQYDPTAFVEDTLGSHGAFVNLVGSGVVRIYRDGVQITGTWRRASLQHFFQFVDANGNTIPLKPGNTWFELAPLGYVPTLR